MLDLEIIKENYASMQIAKLIFLARNESHDLTPEAFDLLKKEFANRNLSIEDYLPPQSNGMENIPTSEISFNESSFKNTDEQMQGQTYNQIMYEKIGDITQNNDSKTEDLSEEKLESLIRESKNIVQKNAAIVLVGLAITIITFKLASESGGSYVVAWGAILFGGIGVFRAYEAQKKYEELLKNKKNEN